VAKTESRVVPRDALAIACAIAHFYYKRSGWLNQEKNAEKLSLAEALF
jgi:hypothetical protein